MCGSSASLQADLRYTVGARVRERSALMRRHVPCTTPTMLTHKALLAIAISVGASGCAAQAQDDEGESAAAAIETNPDGVTDLGHGWTKRVLGPSQEIAAACTASGDDEPCGTGFRGHFEAAKDRGVDVTRGNTGRYYLAAQSESAWLHLYSTLTEDAPRPDDNERVMYVGGTFSIKSARHYFDKSGERCVHFAVRIGIDIANKGYPARHGFSADICESDIGKRIRYQLDSGDETSITIDWGT